MFFLRFKKNSFEARKKKALAATAAWVKSGASDKRFQTRHPVEHIFFSMSFFHGILRKTCVKHHFASVFFAELPTLMQKWHNFLTHSFLSKRHNSDTTSICISLLWDPFREMTCSQKTVVMICVQQTVWYDFEMVWWIWKLSPPKARIKDTRYQLPLGDNSCQFLPASVSKRKSVALKGLSKQKKGAN